MARRSDQVIREVDGFTSKLTARTAVIAVELLKKRTPVKTGWARSNWVLSVGAPTTTPVGSPDAVSDAASDGSIALISSAYKTRQGLIFINNRVPYINNLNRGHSGQAEAGFIERTLNEAITLAGRSR